MMHHHLHTTDYKAILFTLVPYTLLPAFSKRGHEARLSETTQQAVTLSAKMKTKDADIKHE